MSGREVLGSRAPLTISRDLVFHQGLVHVAPQPILAGFFGARYGVSGLVGVFVSVLVLGGVATADLAARRASPLARSSKKPSSLAIGCPFPEE
jgi:hypothetical protein